MKSRIEDDKLLIDCTTSRKRITPREVGGKGWNLFVLRDHGFSVPTWCVVSTQAFDHIVDDQRSRIAGILTTTNYSSQESLESASSAIDRLIDVSCARSTLQTAIDSLLGQWCRDGLHFAVRSSIVGEDSLEHSFAGLMDSFLNVCPSAILEKVIRVWRSAFSPRALSYRHHKELSLTDISAGVIVQQMVESAKSGVLFTRNPDSREAHCIISAGYGIGEGVVSNQVETDTYTVDLKSNVITKGVARKLLRTVVDNEQMNGTRLEEVPRGLQSIQVLSDRDILQLRDLGVEAEKSFRTPQDIEWAIDATGKLVVLQSRPIVFAPTSRHGRAQRIWDNSNIIESYPGLTLPLTFSFVRSAYEAICRNAALGFAPIGKPRVARLPFFKNMIGLLDGRVYYNLLNWYEMLAFMPGFQKYKRSWDQMIGISKETDFKQKQLFPLSSVLTLCVAAWNLLTVRGNARRFKKKFRELYDGLRDLEFSHAGEEELILLYESLSRELQSFWHVTLYNDFAAIKYYGWLKQLCSCRELARFANLHNNLLCGEHGVESVEPVRSAVRIAELIRGNPSYSRLFSQNDDLRVWESIRTEDRYRELKRAMEHHLREYGDRGLEELKLENETLRENPASLIALIRNYVLMGLSVDNMESQEQSMRQDAERTVRQNLRNVVLRLLFLIVVRNARRAIANRENMRFDRSRIYGVFRRIFRRMGELFARQGILEQPSDLFYLTVEEVFGYVQGTAVTQDLKSLVELRKREYSRFAEGALDERIQTDGIPYRNSFRAAVKEGPAARELRGIGCSTGIVVGKAKVVLDPREANGTNGQVLVARSTDPGWVFLMISSKGIVVEKGSVLSHTAIIGRELGIPTIVGVKDATTLIPHGSTISIDGSTGVIQWQ